MHEKSKEVTKKIDVKRAGRKLRVWVKWRRKTLKESFLSAKVEQERAFHWRSALRDSLLSIWRVDIHQALRMCQEREQIEVELLSALYGSLTGLTTSGQAEVGPEAVFLQGR